MNNLTIFLDAKTLARLVTRTLLIVGGLASGFVPVFSRSALDEADRQLADDFGAQTEQANV